jgi:hypothetical protein
MNRAATKSGLAEAAVNLIWVQETKQNKNNNIHPVLKGPVILDTRKMDNQAIRHPFI